MLTLAAASGAGAIISVKSAVFVLFLLTTITVPAAAQFNHTIDAEYVRDLQASNEIEKTLTLNILNLTFKQPFSPFFVLVHNSNADPLYTAGQPAPRRLAYLAENGNPSRLINHYRNRKGVKSAKRYNAMTTAGNTSQITVTVSNKYPLVSIASMCENTNDCFVALNGIRVEEGIVLDEPGMDAGSEENNESCDSVPGPFCNKKGEKFVKSGNGEGYVHVHRGVAGDADLSKDLDWRNPMMRVSVTRSEPF